MELIIGARRQPAQHARPRMRCGIDDPAALLYNNTPARDDCFHPRPKSRESRNLMAVSFKENDLIWNDTHGIGRITLFDEEGILIEFDTGAEELFETGPKKHPPLVKLDPAGFLLQYRTEPDAMRALAAEKPADIIALLHTDFGETLKDAQIQRIVSGRAVDPDAWSEWWKSAQAALKDDPRFNLEKNSVQYLGDMVEIAGDLLHEFKTARNLKERQRAARKILKMEEKGVPVDDAKEAAILFFAGTAANASNTLGARLEALLFLETLDPVEYRRQKASIEDRVKSQDVQDAAQALADITDKIIAGRLLDIYKVLLADKFIDIAFTLTKRYKKQQRDWILDSLLEDENPEYIKILLDTVLRDIPTNQQPFVWFGMRMLEKPEKLMELGYDRSDIVRRFFKLLLDAHITSAFSSNPKDGPSVSREEDEIKKFLLQKKNIVKLLKKHPDEIVLQFAHSYMDNKALSDEDKKEMLNMMRETWTSLNFEAAAAAAAAGGAASEIALTQEAYDKYESEYRDIVDVQMPEISKEIGRAREFGDLSENAEYHAAKEKQGMLASRMRYLERLLETASIISQ